MRGDAREQDELAHYRLHWKGEYFEFAQRGLMGRRRRFMLASMMAAALESDSV